MMFSFGQEEHNRLEVDVLGYECEQLGHSRDDNWLATQILFSAGGFRGNVNAQLMTFELAEFLAQLRRLHDTLQGTAEFSTLEGQLSLKLTGDGRGHIKLVGEVMDQPGIGNRVNFKLDFDQSELGRSVRELEQVTTEFPVRSN